MAATAECCWNAVPAVRAATNSVWHKVTGSAHAFGTTNGILFVAATSAGAERLFLITQLGDCLIQKYPFTATSRKRAIMPDNKWRYCANYCLMRWPAAGFDGSPGRSADIVFAKVRR